MSTKKEQLRLNELNDDVLLVIFEKCSINDLLNLCYVCKHFQALIKNKIFLRRSRNLLLVGHRNKSAISYQRTIQDISYYKRVKIFQNWCFGRYQEHIFFNQTKFNPSKICLEKEFLFKSHSGQVRVYRRSINHILHRRSVKTYGNVKDADITCLLKDNENIFIGNRNGRVKIIALDDNQNDSIDEINVNMELNSDHRVESIDFYNDIFATATMQKTVLWRKCYELHIPYLEPVAKFSNGLKCIKLSSKADKLALGKYKDPTRKALHLVDLETQVESTLGCDSSSIYDIQWRDEHTILTGHYDTTLRLFDNRSNRDEHVWLDPYDLAIYSISFDGNFGVLCGMKYHCRVNLYDLRVPNKYIQLYFPKSRIGNASSNSSPAYQVVNDQSQLFIATDHNLRVLDFDADWAESKDYTNMFVHEMIVNINT